MDDIKDPNALNDNPTDVLDVVNDVEDDSETDDIDEEYVEDDSETDDIDEEYVDDDDTDEDGFYEEYVDDDDDDGDSGNSYNFEYEEACQQRFESRLNREADGRYYIPRPDSYD